MIKVYLKKAYDSIDWLFLHTSMEEMGIPPKICRLDHNLWHISLFLYPREWHPCKAF